MVSFCSQVGSRHKMLAGNLLGEVVFGRLCSLLLSLSRSRSLFLSLRVLCVIAVVGVVVVVVVVAKEVVVMLAGGVGSRFGMV